jgi:ParB-like chromosome segregation protein Spo0J
VALHELDLRYAHLRLRRPSQLARIRHSVERENACPPVLASDAVAEGKLVLIDGFKRVEILRDLGRMEIAVRVLPLDAVAGQAAMLSANAAQCGLSDLEEGLIVQNLHRAHGLTQVEIAGRVEHHKSWVCRRLALVEQLDPALREDVRLGLLSATVVREVVRLPRGNQARAAHAIREHGLSSRQAGRLVRLLLALDPHSQEAALRDPLGYSPDPVRLMADDEARSRRPPLGPLGQELRGHMLRLREASRATLRLLTEPPPMAASPKDRRILGNLAGSVLPMAQKALTVLESHFRARKGTRHVDI